MLPDRSDALQLLADLRLIPVVVIDNAEHAVALGEALLAGGLPCAEVTLRTDAAADSIKRLSHCEGICLGAGTVLSVDQVKSAVDCGAEFIVAPGFNSKVVRYCIDQGIVVIPGVCTPTQIEMGLECGLNVLKFFPAEAFGGVATLKAISAPYPTVKFIPTGGIDASNLSSYLALDNVLACGGSWMAKKELIRDQQFERITSLTAQAVRQIARI